jgi:hypothetical protein
MVFDPDFSDGGPDMALIARIVCQVEFAEIDMPHIVITRLDGEVIECSGPHPHGLAALIAAEHAQRCSTELGFGDGLTYDIAALYPAVACAEALARATGADDSGDRN